jgi:hypothetical protein
MRNSFDSDVLGKFNQDCAAIGRQIDAKAEELRAAYQRITDLEDLARNVAGLDLRLINNVPMIRAAVIEWRDQAGDLLS